LRLSQGVRWSVAAILRIVPTCPPGSTGATARGDAVRNGPALGTRACAARVAVAGQGLGIQWTAGIVGSSLASIDCHAETKSRTGRGFFVWRHLEKRTIQGSAPPRPETTTRFVRFLIDSIVINVGAYRPLLNLRNAG